MAFPPASILGALLAAGVYDVPTPPRVARKDNAPHGVAQPPGSFARGPKVGRNDPCPCGSGRKYKACCRR